MRTATFVTAIASAITALAAPAAPAAPVTNVANLSVPAGYVWSIPDYLGYWYYSAWVSVSLNAPQATSGNVIIPALSFTAPCQYIGGPVTFSCNQFIANNTDNRSVSVTIRPWNRDDERLFLDTTYQFTSGGSTYQVHGTLFTDYTTTPQTLTVIPTTLSKVG
ncbi:hypothetical protein BU23DRAFT_550894 [Bimuria novae-zelandiae CBS 107.79]|uniref:Uncharacterized protein n=1 Tax=Bimuria novae-zelandiae CBS 107.79 TaxID=1447943 RepID=A0A6A5VMC3_9PLEO|nr:hypothetical protein BU23DRAFT_550894 [Bimuria novae-zelandiae CBS 107.79]